MNHMGEPEALLTAKGIVKKYDEFQLGPVDLSLRAGRSYGLLGPNGSGKTTLLHCLVGQSRIDAGEIIFRDQRVRWGDWEHRESISIVLERPALYDELTVGQTLRLGSLLFKTWDRTFACSWVDRLKLRVHQRVRTLSKGTKVKLSLILALAHQATLLLLDEPTAGLDPNSRADLQSLLKEMVSQRRATLLISSHLFEDMEALADDILVLQSGKIVLQTAVGSGFGEPERGQPAKLRDLYFRITSPESKAARKL